MKILVVEDDALIAEDIALTLVKNEFQISAIVYNMKDAIHELRTNIPDIALLDINLNNKMDGIDIALFIQENVKIPFIYITSYSDKITLERAKSTEPSGYIVKPYNEASLYTSVEIALHNYSQKNKRHFPEISIAKINSSLADNVSEREFELLKLIYDGKTNKQIADTLFISGNTVKKHINNIYLKLETTSRATTIAKLRELMLVD